jgi:hypothetical protein
MSSSVIALFGEAEKGELGTIHFCRSVEQLFHFFGQPPHETEGLFHAIQALLYGNSLIYFRVHEEGMSTKDYLFGLRLLHEYAASIPHVGALFLPKVGSQTIINESISVCEKHRSLLILREADFYDYITDHGFLMHSET